MSEFVVAKSADDHGPYDMWSLFHDHHTLVLPSMIDERAYHMIIRAVIERPDEQIILHCSGEGGSAYDTMSIVALIKRHGNFVANLTGYAASAHSVIFAACQTRYIYPFASIGVHECAARQTASMDRSYSEYLRNDMERINRYNARVYASACQFGQDIHSPEFWLGIMRSVGSQSLELFDDDSLIAMGMAQAIGGGK